VFIDIFMLCFYLLYFLFKLWRPKDYNLGTIFRFLHCRWIIIICNLVVFKIGLLFCTQHSCQYKVNIYVICKRIYFFITVL